MTVSLSAGQSMELREEPRQFVASSQSSVYPKSTGFTIDDDDEPPAYINDPPLRTRDQYPRTRSLRDESWRNLNGVSSISSPSCDHSSNARVVATAEAPLRPNRREDSEFGRENIPPISQVLLPISANKKLTRTKSSGGNSAKNWLRNIKSPIGELRVYSYLTFRRADRRFP